MINSERVEKIENSRATDGLQKLIYLIDYP